MGILLDTADSARLLVERTSNLIPDVAEKVVEKKNYFHDPIQSSLRNSKSRMSPRAPSDDFADCHITFPVNLAETLHAF